MLAESNQKHLLWHSQPGALGFPKSCCHCLALYWIHYLPCSSLRCHFYYPNSNSTKPIFAVTGMLSGALSTSLSAEWWSIHFIRRAFNSGVRPPGRSFADNAGGKGDLSDILNAVTPSCWKFDWDVLMFSSVSEMYPMAVIRVLSAQVSFAVACIYWIFCDIPK